ncbi:MAG: sodium:solute symporter family protein [Fibrobacteraceae bacterium]|nr:sodium:solute symporter family protein [Fibrobacteraceae bacterium]
MGFILIIYFFALVLIAWQSAAQVKSVSDFFVARKGGSVLMITGSLVATILGGSAVIGAIDAGPRLGGASTWFLLTGAIGLLALLPFLPRICKLGRFTLPDLMEDLYGKGPRTVASIIIPVAWTGVVAAQIIASGKILQSFTGMNYMAGAIVSGVIFIGYTLAGGQFSVLRTDFLQAALIILGIVLLTVFAYLHPITYMGIPAPAFPFNENFSVLDLVLLLLTYATAYTAGPDMYSRLFCAKDEKTAQRSVVIAAMILSLVAACIGFLSSYGAALNFTSGARIIEIGRVVLPHFLLPVLGLCLLSVVLSSADTTLLSSSIIITRLCTLSPVSDVVEIRRTRLVILLNGIVALVIAINFTDIIGMMLLALAVYAGAFTLPILLGLAGMKVKTPFISAAIILGGVLALLGKLIPPSMGAHTGDVFLVLAFIVNGALMLLGRIKIE